MNPNDELAAREEAVGRARADSLRAQGGLCDVGDFGYSGHLFTVRLVDGRVFTRCAVHGSGGMLRGSKALELARRQTGTVRIYLVSHWWGDLCLTVPRDQVAWFDRYDPSP